MENFKPPVLKLDILNSNMHVWGIRPLGQHIPDMERLLMIDADAPVAFDAIPLRDSGRRSKELVDVFTRSYAANPALGPLIKRVGGALMQDRKERSTNTDAPGFEEDLQKITRVTEVKQAYRPRG